MSSVDTYRGQQGLTGKVSTSHFSPDPQVISWIKQASAATGADPVALLATALQESGGKLHGAAGDGGTSFGTFQFHIGGALGSHTPAWASTYPAFLNRAQEFARLGVRGGRGAAAVQRPGDPKLYAQGVDSLMATAHALLQGATGVMPAAPAQTSSLSQVTPGYDYYAKSGPQAALDILNAKGPAGARMLFDSSQQKLHMPAQTVQPRVLPSAPVSTATAAVPTSHTAGVFEGTRVASWMIPALAYARAHGWKGKLTSGVRTTAEQKVLYARYQAGGNIAAKPGQSNHELQNGGAFDATDPQQLAAILKAFGGQKPIWAPTVGLNDTPHFSLTGR